MMLQIDCYSDNSNTDVHATLNKDDVDSTLNLHVDQAGTCSGDLCNDYGEFTLDEHDPKIGPEDGAVIRYYVSHALGMLLHDENSYEFLAFYDRSILTEYVIDSIYYTLLFCIYNDGGN